MKNSVELHMLGQKLVVRSEEEEEHVRAVERYLSDKVEEVRQNTKAVSTLDLALLTALNVTGEFIKLKETLDNFERRSEELTKLIDRRVA
ncbi:MAG: cell division protein ZapA [Thermodesulfobacteriota bacterium]